MPLRVFLFFNFGTMIGYKSILCEQVCECVIRRYGWWEVVVEDDVKKGYIDWRDDVVSPV